ncbi:sn-glycerol-3-phosphate ABC transporter ATP-binding protein UgpC [Alginatibacterium sediminis]|uniref:sn-glycerol-3-phosphate ABC transporter ATP-binding protein UgpC n=1 Tax=Alginatibacterium sediminis TaxID=2164068 RepID=A0A420EB37_9ALTE|nr:sn-glycerol-3-phosphate ABC transporter ATP-binding protein UgpC [Alginatibacterium sediminis]RKF17909.1 sn-glycerol-3-phosphate ABC transporter ATP-binding protein UgpC [Alginatibacterium sediminis]
MADVILKSVIKRFGKTQTIHGIDLSIDSGDFVVFVGPSGCGKSTLLRMIAGLEEVTEGDIYIDGDCVTNTQPSKRGIAMVFQSYALYPHMSVRENMSFGLEVTGESQSFIDERVSEAASVLKLDDYLDRKPRELSGGQRQRVAIGRTIVRKPKVFLFDEPLSNLDAELRVQMRIEISKLHDQLGNTMIYVTHDQVEAMTMADKIVVLREGVVEQVGTPLNLYHNPANKFVAGFIGSPRMNFLPVIVVQSTARMVLVQLPNGQNVELEFDGSEVVEGQKLEFGVRPEHYFTGAGGDIELELEVEVVEKLGGTTFVYGLLSGFNMTAEVDGDAIVSKGSSMVFSFDRNRVHLFLEDGLALSREQLLANATQTTP